MTAACCVNRQESAPDSGVSVRARQPDAPKPEAACLGAEPVEASGALRNPEQELARLMQQVALGCRVSFERLYVLTSPRLFGIVLRIIPVRPDAEEVVQETYVKAWTERAMFDSNRGKVMFWLSAIARYGAIDSLRRRRASLPLNLVNETVEAADSYASFASATHGPLESTMLKQSAHAVQQILETLPDAQRQSLALAFYDGLSHAEIAHRLGWPLGTVKSAVRRALLKMRPALADHR